MVCEVFSQAAVMVKCDADIRVEEPGSFTQHFALSRNEGS